MAALRNGRRRCSPLADRLRPFLPATLASSSEPKAVETAARIGERLQLPISTDPDLREHRRTRDDWLDGDAYPAAIARLFALPDDRTFGGETANAALRRFSAAVARHLARQPALNAIVVGHGTVIALFVASRTGLPPFPLWQRLGLPSFVVLSLPDDRLVTVIESVPPPEPATDCSRPPS
jgi:broad specificity phosphatase PhoE